MSSEASAATPKASATKIRKRVFWWASGVCGLLLLGLQAAQFAIGASWNPFDFSKPVDWENWVAVAIMVATSVAAALATGAAASGGSDAERLVSNVINSNNKVGDVNSHNKVHVDHSTHDHSTRVQVTKSPPTEYERLMQVIAALPAHLQDTVGGALKPFLDKASNEHLFSKDQYDRIVAVLEASKQAEAEALRRLLDQQELHSNEKLNFVAIEYDVALAANQDEIARLRTELEGALDVIKKAMRFSDEFGKVSAAKDEFRDEMKRKGLAPA